ncbi:MAG: hypothetical protein WC663_00790 [Patescibacteria group bacterium]|jgi:hypothetical protein
MCGHLIPESFDRFLDRELSGNAIVGLYAGKIVTIVSDWMDANREKHYAVRLPSGDVNHDVRQDEITFDPKLIRAKTH